MNSYKSLVYVAVGALLSATALAQNHADHDHSTPTDHTIETSNSTQGDGDAHAVLTHTDDIHAALEKGGEPIVADVMGVVCDFCALAMNKIFSKREEIAAVYVDLDTKALNLVLVPGATLSDGTIEELAVQAGYRITAVRRGAQALSNAS